MDQKEIDRITYITGYTAGRYSSTDFDRAERPEWALIVDANALIQHLLGRIEDLEAQIARS